jgi:uncharacterized LabA/DUF88 family protein
LKNNPNIAYIDGANLHRGIKGLGWELDYRKLRVWLSEKYNVSRAYIFLGLVPKYKDLYAELQDFGYSIIFKDTTYDGHGQVKGNCDADLVLKAVCDAYENSFSKALIISSDGDYASLVKFLSDRKKILVILAHDEKKCSILLKRTNVRITYLKEFRANLEKAPDEDGTSQGSFS